MYLNRLDVFTTRISRFADRIQARAVRQRDGAVADSLEMALNQSFPNVQYLSAG